MTPQIRTLFALLLLGASVAVQAAVLPQAEDSVKIALTKKPTSRPMAVAYVPDYKRYYVADGGFGAVSNNSGELVLSKSEIHAYSAKGEYLHSVLPGIDNRSLYYNQNKHRLESVSYNVSSGAGFTPYCGIFALKTNDKGDLTTDTDEIINFNPAFGDAPTGPSYDPDGNRYFAKQIRSNKVLVVKTDSREKIAEISLDLGAAGAQFDDISDYFAAWTGIPGEELAVLDIDHKAILVFNEKGKFVGRSLLPAGIKLRAQNHYNGSGYANGLFFVYSETEGEFGTYHGYHVSDQVVSQ
jgi:DNA-binding beta-propeller fold protein YncE